MANAKGSAARKTKAYPERIESRYDAANGCLILKIWSGQAEAQESPLSKTGKCFLVASGGLSGFEGAPEGLRIQVNAMIKNPHYVPPKVDATQQEFDV